MDSTLGEATALPESLERVIRGKPDRAALPDVIPEGERNDTLMREAGRLRARGADEAKLRAALLDLNRRCCRPPLEPAEVEKIVQSAMRWPAGRPSSPRQPKLGSSTEPFSIHPRRIVDALEAKELNFDEFALLTWLVHRADFRTRQVERTLAAIKRESRWAKGRDTLSGALKDLRRDGWIAYDVKKGQQKPIVFTLVNAKVRTSPETSENYRSSEGGEHVSFRKDSGLDSEAALRTSEVADPRNAADYAGSRAPSTSDSRRSSASPSKETYGGEELTVFKEEAGSREEEEREAGQKEEAGQDDELEEDGQEEELEDWSREAGTLPAAEQEILDDLIRLLDARPLEDPA